MNDADVSTAGAARAVARTEPRRELWLRCDPQGNVVGADKVAMALLDAAPGTSLASLCVPGTPEKLALLLQRSRTEALD
ncbi:MAG TPA: hypothetical protein VFZ61_07200, partial [Polyangiales bacterium]